MATTGTQKQASKTVTPPKATGNTEYKYTNAKGQPVYGVKENPDNTVVSTVYTGQGDTRVKTFASGKTQEITGTASEGVTIKETGSQIDYIQAKQKAQQEADKSLQASTDFYNARNKAEAQKQNETGFIQSVQSNNLMPLRSNIPGYQYQEDLTKGFSYDRQKNPSETIDKTQTFGLNNFKPISRVTPASDVYKEPSNAFDVVMAERRKITETKEIEAGRQGNYGLAKVYGAFDVVSYPIRSTESIYNLGKTAVEGAVLGAIATTVPATAPFILGGTLAYTGTQIPAIQEQINYNFELGNRQGYSYLAEQGAQAVAFTVGGAGAEFGIKNSPVKLEYESTTIPLKGEGSIEYTTIGVKAGTKGYPIASQTTVKPAVYDVTTGKYVTGSNVPLSAEKTYFNLGSPKLNQKIPLSELKSSTAQPLTASSGKGYQGILDYTPQEIQRLESSVKLSSSLGTEKGLPVKEFVINIEGVKNPIESTKIIERVSAEQEGVLFGSLTTKQLPNKPTVLDYISPATKETISLKGFQNVKQGDIDIIFPSKTVEEIKPIIENIATELKSKGENVRVSPSGTNIIEFNPKPGETQGAKFLEAKSGINQETLGLEDTAPAGYLGINFPDLKAGQGYKAKTVPFGETRSITAGEQLQRKGAGASIISPGEAGETASFSLPGVLGKQGNPRGLKDTAGFVQQSAGIIEIKSGKISPIEQYKVQQAKQELNKFLQSYSKEQQADIIAKLKETTGSFEIPLSTPKGEPLNNYVEYTSRSPTSLTTRTDMGTSTFEISKSPRVESPSGFNASPSLNIVSFSPISSPGTPSPSGSAFSPSPSPLSFSPISSSTYSPTSSAPSSSINFSPESPIPPSPNPPSPLPPSPFSPIPPSPNPPSPFGSSTSISTSSIIPPPPTRGGLSLQPETKKKKTGLYKLLIRRRGQFKQAGIFGSEQEAFKKGSNIVGSTASASLKVITPEGRPSLAGRLNPKQFYSSRKEPGVYIERPSQRIKSAGEKAEITFKGIATNRKAKRGVFGGF